MHRIFNNNKMFFVDRGNPAGIPVVLVHGMTFDHRMWLPQIRALKKSGYRVIAYDLRGHGNSGVGDGQYTYGMLVEDLLGLLDHFELDRAVLCGLSMGGAVVLRFMEMHPERVRALILCDTRTEADSDETRRWREQAIASIKKEGLVPFTEQFLRSVFAAGSFEAWPESIDLIRKTILRSSARGICGALLAQAARTDTSAVLSRIRVPTLFLVGSEDVMTPPEVVRSLHVRAPGSEFAVIPRAGHAPNIENPEEFTRKMLEFLGKIERKHPWKSSFRGSREGEAPDHG